MNMSDTLGSPELSDAATEDNWQGQECFANESISFGRRLRRWLWHLCSRQFTLLCAGAWSVARLVGRSQRPIDGDKSEIVLTGRFNSENWIRAHIAPLSASDKCSCLWIISTNPVPELPKVVGVYPPRWLTKILGATQARLLTFTWVAVCKRPHFVGGFHLSFNGIVAVIAGRLAGARSIYFCVGGPPEVCDGGAHSENSLLARMETPDAVVERRLLRFVERNDLVVTMGTRAICFFRDKGVDTKSYAVSGGIDSHRFQAGDAKKTIDIILTGRLARVKRIDVFLQAVRCLKERLPEIKAAIVGDGGLRDELEQMALNLGIEDNVTFAGHQHNVQDWLSRAKIFVLTSDSEGLSLSMMEAMMSGLPAVVSEVGDLGDLVEYGVNGYLVARRSPELFADRLVELLSDEARLEAFSQAARRSAMRYETHATTARWNRILAEF